MPGPIETPEGARLGMHRGLMYYTLGQRQGLALGGVRGAAEAPWYVAAKDLERNRLIVVQDAAHPLLTSDGLRTQVAHWIAGSPPRPASAVPSSSVIDRPINRARRRCSPTAAAMSACRFRSARLRPVNRPSSMMVMSVSAAR